MTIEKNNTYSHNTFGGRIYECDFDGYTSINSIASRIFSDWRFDRQCKLNKRHTENYKTNKKGSDNND